VPFIRQSPLDEVVSEATQQRLGVPMDGDRTPLATPCALKCATLTQFPGLKMGRLRKR
jgi:hypothetical protein